MDVCRLPFQSPRARSAQPDGSSPPDGPVWLVDVDARDLNGNGDGNAGWANGDQVNLTDRVVVNRGTLGGVFTQDVAAIGGAATRGWRYFEDDGDGQPALVNTTNNRHALLTSSRAAAEFVDLGPSDGPFAVHVVARLAVSGVFSDGIFAATMAGPSTAGVIGPGFIFSCASQTFTQGQFGIRGVVGGAVVETRAPGYFDPPAGPWYLASYEIEGGPSGECATWANEILGTFGDDTLPASYVTSSAPSGPMTIGGTNNNSARPLRGGIRRVRAAASRGWTSLEYADVVAAGLIPSPVFTD